ncbi:MAG TPA: lysophospholipid acyltransferase family protein [Myxococcota bacterium]|nr:lysophospholipid acyltransferase family protein [Myxococcota bacterium]
MDRTLLPATATTATRTTRAPARAELTSHLRAAARIAGLVAISLAAGAAGLALRTLAAIAPAQARSGERILTRAWARAAAHLVGMRVRVHGTPPSAPGLLVANHLGYVDVIALWTAASGVFVAKSEVGSWPLVGGLGRIFHTVFLDRRRKRDLVRVLAEMDRTLASGRSVVFFAEGTSSRGERVLPFKSSLFEAAVRAGLPVSCAALSYRTRAGDPSADLAVCWWGEMTFPGHVYALLRLRGFEADLRFGPGPLFADDRKELARRAHDAVLRARSGIP